MVKCEEYLAVARNNPRGLSFAQLCTLAECYGFEYSRTKGSHQIFKRPGFMSIMNFQDVGGKAKAYQVKQLLSAIDELVY